MELGEDSKAHFGEPFTSPVGASPWGEASKTSEPRTSLSLFGLINV